MGRIARSARALSAGSDSPSAYSSGAPSGALASAEATSEAGQSRSFTSTTAAGRVAGVRPGYTASATAAAVDAGSRPARRVVFLVATLTTAEDAEAGAAPAAPVFGVEATLPHPPASVPPSASTAISRSEGRSIARTLALLPACEAGCPRWLRGGLAGLKVPAQGLDQVQKSRDLLPEAEKRRSRRAPVLALC